MPYRYVYLSDEADARLAALATLTGEGVGPLVQRLIDAEYRARVGGLPAAAAKHRAELDAATQALLDDGTQVAALAANDPELAQVLTWYFGLGPDSEAVGYAEIGRRLGVTRERGRQLVAKALRRLRAGAGG